MAELTHVGVESWVELTGHLLFDVFDKTIRLNLFYNTPHTSLHTHHVFIMFVYFKEYFFFQIFLYSIKELLRVLSLPRCGTHVEPCLY